MARAAGPRGQPVPPTSFSVAPHAGPARHIHTATTTQASARPTPNSMVTYGVGPVLAVSGSKKFWMNALWLACSNTAGHWLPDRSRGQAENTLEAMTIVLKLGSRHY